MNTLFERGTPPTPADLVPLCIPELWENEWTYIKECLDTAWISSVSAYVDRFEAGLANLISAPYAVAVVNGTAALLISMLVAGVQADDKVLVSSMTFIAPVNVICHVGV